jgi:hypothetical protein
LKHGIEQTPEERKDEEEVSSYSMTVTEREDSGSCRRKQWLTLFEELAMEEATDLS